jgi:hypothetical protein
VLPKKVKRRHHPSIIDFVSWYHTETQKRHDSTGADRTNHNQSKRFNSNECTRSTISSRFDSEASLTRFQLCAH